jgi:pimeloyl-ACP methyl ester carboxylesterase
MPAEIWSQAREVAIPSGDATLAGWLLMPTETGPHPCIVMGHGFSMTRRDGMAAYAEVFLAAGYAVLAFDYRCFGDSTGTPRQRFRIRAQRADWRNAIGYARADPQIAADGIVLWGFSFGGGFAIETAATDRRIAAVLTVCPFLDGLWRALSTPPKLSVWLLPRAMADHLGRHLLVPVAAEPGGHAALAKPGEAAGFHACAGPGSKWRNEISPGIFLTVALYRPVMRARRVLIPVFVARGDSDVTTSPRAVGRLAKRAPHGELYDYPGDHFAVLAPGLAERIASDQVMFLHTTGRFVTEPGG